MASIKINLFLKSLNRSAGFNMFIPNDNAGETADDEKKKGRMKTLFLLHGYTGSGWNWVPEELCSKYNFAVVVPDGENGFWLDGLSTGHKFCTMVGEELVNYVRKTFGLAMNADETCIMGLSMGGFGALHTGLFYPDTFGKIGAMSSALIVHEIAGMKEGSDNGVANYYYYHECFGDLDNVIESDNNPETLAKKLKDNGKKLPEIYMCCGTEDFLLENNRELHKFLSDNDINHEYFESSGTHDMVFWNEYTPKIIEWMFG